VTPSRRRFLLDLAGIGGILAMACGLAATSPSPPPAAQTEADLHHPQYTSVLGGLDFRP